MRSIKLVKVVPGVQGAEEIAQSVIESVRGWSFDPDPKTGKLEREIIISPNLDMSEDIPVISNEFVPKP